FGRVPLDQGIEIERAARRWIDEVDRAGLEPAVPVGSKDLGRVAAADMKRERSLEAPTRSGLDPNDAHHAIAGDPAERGEDLAQQTLVGGGELALDTLAGRRPVVGIPVSQVDQMVELPFARLAVTPCLLEPLAELGHERR